MKAHLARSCALSLSVLEGLRLESLLKPESGFREAQLLAKVLASDGGHQAVLLVRDCCLDGRDVDAHLKIIAASAFLVATCTMQFISLPSLPVCQPDESFLPRFNRLS